MHVPVNTFLLLLPLVADSGPFNFQARMRSFIDFFLRINAGDTFSRFNNVQEETSSTTIQYAGKTVASHVRNVVDSDFAMLSLWSLFLLFVQIV